MNFDYFQVQKSCDYLSCLSCFAFKSCPCLVWENGFVLSYYDLVFDEIMALCQQYLIINICQTVFETFINLFSETVSPIKYTSFLKSITWTFRNWHKHKVAKNYMSAELKKKLVFKGLLRANILWTIPQKSNMEARQKTWNLNNFCINNIHFCTKNKISFHVPAFMLSILVWKIPEL